MSRPEVKRLYEQRGRARGRRQTRAVWYVTLPNGQRWRFRREADAEAFADDPSCPEHDPVSCRKCRGTLESEDS